MILLQECNTIVFIIVTIMFPLNSSEISWCLFSAPSHYLPLPTSAYLKLLILITDRSYFATLNGQHYQDMYGCANLKNKTIQGCLISVGGGVVCLLFVCLFVFPRASQVQHTLGIFEYINKQTIFSNLYLEKTCFVL